MSATKKSSDLKAMIFVDRYQVATFKSRLQESGFSTKNGRRHSVERGVRSSDRQALIKELSHNLVEKRSLSETELCDDGQNILNIA